MSRVYAIPGYDPDDLDQEAALALWQAGDPDGPLATVVVQRRMISLLRAATRERHRALNESVREIDQTPALDLIPGGRDPADIVCERDRLRHLGVSLTERERRALVYVIAGIPYERERWIDNAVTRARRRLREAA